MAKDPIGFDFAQQAAFIGHAFERPSLWDRYDAYGIDKGWFVDPRLAALFDYISDFRDKYKRPPNAEETVSHAVARFDARARQSTEARVKLCVDAAASHPTDALIPALTDWARFQLTSRAALKIQELYDTGKHAEIHLALLDSAKDLKKMEVAAGHGGDRFETMADRVRGEREERLAAGKKVVPFGITFFDDALGGLYRDDLLLWTGRSGSGKTQAASIVVESAGLRGYRIKKFALEASNREIERRIKFRKMLDCWYRDTRDPLVRASPPRWRKWFRGDEKTDAMLAPYEAEADAYFEDDLATVQTYYKKSSRFNHDDLERHILDVHEDTDLFVVDHFDYVEAREDLNENKASDRLITLFRDLSLALKIPFMVICHINKAAEQTLVPDQQDLMGSSHLYKKSTGVITTAPAHGLSTTIPNLGYPTYFRVPKDRVGGALPQVGVGFFDPILGRYSDKYALGYLNLQNTKWSPCRAGKAPEWASSNHFIEGVSAAK